MGVSIAQGERAEVRLPLAGRLSMHGVINAKSSCNVFLGAWRNKGPTIVDFVELGISPPLLERRVGSLGHLARIAGRLGNAQIVHDGGHVVDGRPVDTGGPDTALLRLRPQVWPSSTWRGRQKPSPVFIGLGQRLPAHLLVAMGQAMYLARTRLMTAVIGDNPVCTPRARQGERRR